MVDFPTTSNPQLDAIVQAVIAQLGNQRIGQQSILPNAVQSRQIASLSVNKLTTGIMTAIASIGSANIKIDGINERIIINDGANDRIIIGLMP